MRTCFRGELDEDLDNDFSALLFALLLLVDDDAHDAAVLAALFRHFSFQLFVQLLGTEYKFAVSFVILVVVLLVRPTGIMKGKTI